MPLAAPATMVAADRPEAIPGTLRKGPVSADRGERWMDAAVAARRERP